MIAPNKMNLVRIDTFECKQQTNSFKRMGSSINEIAQKHVVIILNIFFLAVFVRSAIQFEETHQVGELSVDVTEDF